MNKGCSFCAIVAAEDSLSQTPIYKQKTLVKIGRKGEIIVAILVAAEVGSDGGVRREPSMRDVAFGIAVGISLCADVFGVKADETAVVPPQGATLLLEVVGDGVQIYTCAAQGSGFEWRFNAPEANLFDKQGRQIGVHFGGPTWKLGDGSTLIGEVIAKSDAPEPGAIQWLLLRTKSHDGSGALSQAAFVVRTDTKGGVAPKTGCDASHLSQEARMHYSATYQFFSATAGG